MTGIEGCKNPLKVEAGRKGGQTTLERHGPVQLKQWGNLGGRPRAQTYDEIRQQQRLEQNNNKEAMGTPGKNLRTLRTLRKLQGYRSSSEEIPQAGIAQETPHEQVPAGKEAR